ncbi:MAG: hypothetical protein QOE79_693 [Sphingomonadales bacterium]|jgi:hypothetical protein|nr:hypothetical protein [Sphingomonadales bacterium]
MNQLGAVAIPDEAIRVADRSPMRDPFLIEDAFLPAAEAGALRAGFEAHFAQPHAHRPETHQIWNYWFVPDLYTYLRTAPEKVLSRELVQSFHERLSRWALERLGLTCVTWPNLSLYVDGCVQHLHNDSTNGRFGFVYSLTLDNRRSVGGETIVLREGDLFRAHLTRSGAGTAMHELIDPRFNRLVLFDDRMPHGVRRIEGAMDPLDGRIVLHGHISEGEPVVRGPHGREEVVESVREQVTLALEGHRAAAVDAHGPLTLRMSIAASGAVEGVEPLVDRVARCSGGDPGRLVADILQRVSELRFSACSRPSEAFLPVMIGGPLPWMRPEPPAAKPAPVAAAPNPAAAPRLRMAPLESAGGIAERLAASRGVSRVPCGRIEAFIVPQFADDEACAALARLIGAEDVECPVDSEDVAGRIDALLGLDPATAEPLAGMRVGASGREARIDFLDTEDPSFADEAERGGQRTWTATLFLDTPVVGGEILFANAGLRMKPAGGHLLVWNNLVAGGEPNGFTVHETLPVAAGSHSILIRRYRQGPALSRRPR